MAEDMRLLTAVRTDERAHVLDNAKHRHLRGLEHREGLQGVGEVDGNSRLADAALAAGDRDPGTGALGALHAWASLRRSLRSHLRVETGAPRLRTAMAVSGKDGCHGAHPGRCQHRL